MKTKLNQSKLKLAIASAIALGAAALASPAYAVGTATGTMTVTTSVANSCTITTGPMTFADYDPSAVVDLDATATITSTCTSGGSTKMTMSQGDNALTGSSVTTPLRAMDDGNDNALGYFLYSDSAGGTVWGDTADTGKAITATGNADPTTVYGRIPKGQTPPAGSYTDSVLVTLTY